MGVMKGMRTFAVRMLLMGAGLGAVTSVAAPASAVSTNDVDYVRVSDIPRERITRIVVHKSRPIVARTIEMTTNTISATISVRSVERRTKTYMYSGFSATIDKLCRCGLQKVPEKKDLSVGGIVEAVRIYIGEKAVFSGYLYHRDGDNTSGNLKCKGGYLPDVEPLWLEVMLTNIERELS